MSERRVGNGPLTGRVILVTRPARQGERLAGLVRAAGGEPYVFPTLAIEPVAISAHAAALLERPDVFSWALFVSVNAVAHGLPLLPAPGAWPPGLRVAAIGAGTAAALREGGVPLVLAPSVGGDSEALLGLAPMQQVSGQRVLVFRGVGGRELLAETLRARGAQVEYVECYRRMLPAADPAPLRARLRRGELAAVTAASAEALANLLALAGAQAPALLALPVFVTHANVAAAAQPLGFDRVRVTPASDEGLVQGMMAFFAAPA